MIQESLHHSLPTSDLPEIKTASSAALAKEASAIQLMQLREGFNKSIDLYNKINAFLGNPEPPREKIRATTTMFTSPTLFASSSALPRDKPTKYKKNP